HHYGVPSSEMKSSLERLRLEMNSLKIAIDCLRFCLTIATCLVATSPVILAQPGIKELTVSKPKERSNADRVIIRTVTQQPTKGTLAVVHNYEVSAAVVVKDVKGKLIAQTETDAGGQAEFQLRRGQIYQVEVNHPSYKGSNGKTKALSATEII